MRTNKIISCLMALLFTTSINSSYTDDSKIKVYDNLYELGSTMTPKRVNEEDTSVAQLNVSDVKVQVTTLEENQTRDMRFVAAIDSLDYTEVGFEITLIKSETETKTITQKVEVAYTGMIVDGEVNSTATLFGSTYNYMIAFEVTDIPAVSYGYTYSAVAYVKTATNEAKSSTPKDISISNIAFDDMINAATKSFTLTKVEGYNSNWLSLGWAESSTNISNVDFDFTKNVYYRLTLNDGTILYFDKGNSTCYQDGATENIFGVNCQFEGLNTEEGFKKVEVILNNNGELNYGYIEFFALSQLTNLNVSEDYILTFDTLENASSYTVRIYNDSYSGNEMTINSGDKLTVTTLAEGTYNIDVTAIGSFGYSNSVTTLENAFTIETTQEILDAPVGAYTFDFDRTGRGIEWETPVKITWSDEKYAATLKTSTISDFGFYVNQNKQSDLGAIDGFENKYYDDGEYYGIYFTTNGIHWDNTATTVYSLRFYITTDSGQVYYVNHHFYVNAIVDSSDLNFIQEGTTEYDDIINASYKYYLDTEMDISKAINNSKMSASSIYSDGTQKDSNSGLAIDGDTGTRWESATEDDVTLVIDLGDTYTLNKISIMWEPAYAKNFDILVSTNGEEYETYASITDAPNFAGQYASSFKPEGSEMQARYVKIHCKERATTYGNSIWEILFFAA